MGFHTTQDLLILKELKRRAATFAADYDPDLPTVILVPGGMGSRLLKTREAVEPGRPFPEQPTFDKLWLSFGAILRGALVGLRMTRDGRDRGNRPVIAFGEVSSPLAKKYDRTESYFAGPNPVFAANYVPFGYDWRKLPRVGAGYLRQFLLFLANEAQALGKADPRPRTTLLGHSQGGLVIKMLLNDLDEGGEAPGEWLARFVSIGTPFYGTQNHLSRYYVGVSLVNSFSPGGRPEITDIVWSLPGPYVLLPSPTDVLEPRFEALGLERYPMADRDDPTLATDGFESAQRPRLPGFMTGDPGSLRFTVLSLASAAQELRALDRDLSPGFRERVFHVRSTRRQGPIRPLEISWQNLDGASHDPVNGPDPISFNDGDSDGTVPLWSARLASTPEDQVFTFRGLRHGGLAEQDEVLDLVAALIREEQPQVPEQSQDLAMASEAEVLALLEEVRTGQRDEAELARQPATVQCRFETLLELV